MRYDSPVYYFQLRIFSCLTYSHVRYGNIESIIKKYLFLRFAYKVKGYILWYNDPKYLELIIYRNVMFNESTLLDSSEKKKSYENYIIELRGDVRVGTK